MKRVNYYSVSGELARVLENLSTTYRTKDGRFILSEKQLERLLRSYSKKIDPSDVVEITENEARKLIQAGGYQMGEVTNK